MGSIEFKFEETEPGMKFMVTDRQKGKTSALIRHLIRNDKAVMIVHSHQEADRLYREYKHLGLERDRFITTNTRERPLRGSYGVVDNADLILSVLLGMPITHVTATGRIVHEPRFD